MHVPTNDHQIAKYRSVDIALVVSLARFGTRPPAIAAGGFPIWNF
jgi:hypothetical protein